ncbi:MAG: hypothetical protein IPP51_16720 [Bacteroidetes bacterium]|nr:hypothetical protein [Bacteroidota bacterium]
MEPITVKNGMQIIKFNYDGNGSALAKKPDGSFLKMSAEQLDRALFPPQEIKTPSGAILSIRPRREPIATTDVMNGFKIWAVIHTKA